MTTLKQTPAYGNKIAWQLVAPVPLSREEAQGMQDASGFYSDAYGFWDFTITEQADGSFLHTWESSRSAD